MGFEVQEQEGGTIPVGGHVASIGGKRTIISEALRIPAIAYNS
jgi:hypothetical protein